MGDAFRCGTVALLGCPNVGKSTLINRLIGAKIAIVTPKPQTTRHKILGILSEESCQIVFVDTPGIHKAKTRMNRAMVRAAFAAAEEADILAIMQDASRPMDEGTRRLILRLASQLPRKIRIHLLNKVDKIEKERLLPRIDETCKLDPNAESFIPISAKKGIQVDAFLQLIRKHLPISPPMYDPDWYTDQSQRRLAEEYVREQIFYLMQDEIPFQTAVEVESFQEKQTPRPCVTIHAQILVANERHKAMVIGKRGDRLKKIGMQARKGLEKTFGCKVNLFLFVKVQPGWFDNELRLQELGISSG